MRKILALIFLFVFLLPTPVLADSFKPFAGWDGTNIVVSYEGYERDDFITTGVVIVVQKEGGGTWESESIVGSSLKKTKITDLKLAKNGSIPQPQEGEVWTVTFKYDNKTYSQTVECTLSEQSLEDGMGAIETEENWRTGAISIFPGDSQKAVMFWYYSLATLSGAFIFLLFIRTGYQHIFSPASNPGVRASVLLSIQRGFIGLIIIMLVPFFVNLLIMVNDTVVDFCRQGLEFVANIQPVEIGDVKTIESKNSFLDALFSWPIDRLNDIMTTILGLTPLGDIIFNQTPDCSIFQPDVTSGRFINTNNPFADALLRLVMLLFTFYFNAVYVIRRWVVTAIMAVTPIIIWLWAISDHKQIIGLWGAELTQTIFMQTFHALTFGIVFSILAFSGGDIGYYLQGVHISALLIGIGKYIAAFGGVFCAAVLVKQAYSIILNADERERAVALSRIKSAIAGLMILGLSYLIASAIFPQEISIYSQGTIDAGGTILNIGEFEEAETHRISLFVLIFALFAVIPISKMLSNIFMNILARFGTVDEMRVASGGLSGLGRLAGAISGAIVLGGVFSGGMASSKPGISIGHHDTSNQSRVDNLTAGGTTGSSGGSSGINPGGGSTGGTGSSGSIGGGGTTGGYGGSPAGGFGSSPVDDADYGSGISADGYGYGRDYYNSGDLDSGGYSIPNSQNPASAEDEIDLDLRICNYIPDEPEQDNGPSYFSEVRDVLQNNKEKIDKITKTTTKLSMAAGEAIGSIVPGTEKIAGTIAGTGAFLTAKTATPIAVGAGVALKRAHQAAKNAGWHPGVRMDDQ